METTNFPSSPVAPNHVPTTLPSPRRWQRWLLAVVVVAAGLTGGIWYYSTHQPQDHSRLVLQGNIDVRQVNLSFKVDGRIETLAVDEGDMVKAGQVLATLDKRYFQDDLRVAHAPGSPCR
jgi:HlyD family secretion protein